MNISQGFKNGEIRFQIDLKSGRVMLIAPGEAGGKQQDAMTVISLSPEEFQRFELMVGAVAMQVVSYIEYTKEETA